MKNKRNNWMGHCFQNLFSLSISVKPVIIHFHSPTFLVYSLYHTPFTRHTCPLGSQSTFYLFIYTSMCPLQKRMCVIKLKWLFILKIIGRNYFCCINFVLLNLSSKYLNTHLVILGPSPESWLTWNNNEALWQLSV